MTNIREIPGSINRVILEPLMGLAPGEELMNITHIQKVCDVIERIAPYNVRSYVAVNRSLSFSMSLSSICSTFSDVYQLDCALSDLNTKILKFSTIGTQCSIDMRVVTLIPNTQPPQKAKTGGNNTTLDERIERLENAKRGIKILDNEMMRELRQNRLLDILTEETLLRLRAERAEERLSVR